MTLSDAISLGELSERQKAVQGWLPLQQSAEYGAALTLMGAYAQAYVEEHWMALVLHRRLAGIVPVHAVMRGPVGHGSSEEMYHFLKALAPCWPGAMLWSAYDKALNVCRDVPVLISPSYTVWCDVQLGIKPHAKWVKNLERVPEGLVYRKQPWNSAAGAWLRTQENEQRQQKGYKALPPEFVDAYEQAKGKMTLMAAYENKEIVAAQLCLRHGNSATYWMGATTERGRDCYAHYALLIQMMDYLRGRGTRWLDLGGVETEHSPGLARFKLGTGGVVTSTGGTRLL